MQLASARQTPEEDEALENELLADEKELSEHNMLVDLAAMTSVEFPRSARSKSPIT